MNKHFLSRREFNALCAAVGLSSVPAGAMALSGTSVFAADAPVRTAKLRNSAIVPAIGQGSARLGQGRHPQTADRVFLVSKVEANEVSGDGMARACLASLSRLGTNFLDLYLLHWPVPGSQFSES